MTVTIHDGCHFFNNISNLFQVFSESLVIQVKGQYHLFRHLDIKDDLFFAENHSILRFRTT